MPVKGLQGLEFRVKDWGPAPTWVAFVDCLKRTSCFGIQKLGALIACASSIMPILLLFWEIAGVLCDNLLTCIVRAYEYNKPVFVAPAMNITFFDLLNCKAIRLVTEKRHWK